MLNIISIAEHNTCLMLQGIYDPKIKIEKSDCKGDLLTKPNQSTEHYKDKMWHNNAFGKACLNLSHGEQLY